MGRLAPSRWTFTPAIGRSRSRPGSKKSARRIPSASRARKGDGKRRDRLDGARGSDGGGRVWWRDPETGGLSGVARRSLVAAAAQLAFAAVAVKSQRLYDVWRRAGWGESSWRSVTHGGGRERHSLGCGARRRGDGGSVATVGKSQGESIGDPDVIHVLREFLIDDVNGLTLTSHGPLTPPPPSLPHPSPRSARPPPATTESTCRSTPTRSPAGPCRCRCPL